MITSTGNARVKQLVTWQKKRKARDEEGVYIVEGIRMYREAPRAQVREVYVSEQFYSRYGEELGLSAASDVYKRQGKETASDGAG